MWNAIKYGIKAYWPIMIGMLTVVILLLALQRQVFFELMYSENGLPSVIFPTKSWVFLLFLLCGCMMACVSVQYLYFSSGNVRLKLIRNHRMELMFGHTFLVFMFLVLGYMLLSYFLNEGLSTMIATIDYKATQTWKTMIFQEALLQDKCLSFLLVMNLRHTGKMLLWLFTIALWTHIYALSKLVHKKNWIDFIVIFTILPFIFCIIHWIQIPISILLCIFYSWYVNRCWEEKRI